MVKYLKFIGLLVFALAVWQATGNAFIGISADAKEGAWMHLAVDEDTTDAAMTFHVQDSGCFSSPQLPYLPDAELANTIGQIHMFTSVRVQRSSISEYLFSLKGWMAQLSQYEACLSLHREKLYDVTAYSRCQSACEYYIYTLRRILI